MAREQKIDREVMRKMWLAEVATKDIARFFGVSSAAVSATAERLELPRRKRGGALADDLPAGSVQVERCKRPEDVPSFGWEPRQDDALLNAATYGERAELAARWGKPVRAVNARWLVLRSAR